MNISAQTSGSKILENNVDTSIIDIVLYHGWRIGGQIIATTWGYTETTAADPPPEDNIITDLVSRTDRFLFSAVAFDAAATIGMVPEDTNATVVGSVSTPETLVSTHAAGTLVTTWSVDVTEDNTFKIILNANTSLDTPKVDWYMVINGRASFKLHGSF